MPASCTEFKGNFSGQYKTLYNGCKTGLDTEMNGSVLGTMTGEISGTCAGTVGVKFKIVSNGSFSARVNGADACPGGISLTTQVIVFDRTTIVCRGPSAVAPSCDRSRARARCSAAATSAVPRTATAASAGRASRPRILSTAAAWDALRERRATARSASCDLEFRMISHPPMKIRSADDSDVRAILNVLDANRADRSLFQQPEHQVRKTLGDFIVATGDADVVAGCAALRWHTSENAEILAVAVSPEAQGKGVGSLLMRACISRANEGQTAPLVWLATAKPDYFARFGFRPVSRFRLPAGVLWTKFRLVFQQPIGRWVPALVGRHTFMVAAEHERRG